MAQEVVWTERASDDLHNIFEYLSTFSDDHAETVIAEIIDKAFLLEQFPRLVVNQGSFCKIEELIFRSD